MSDLDKLKALFGINADAAASDEVDLGVDDDIARGFATPQMDLASLTEHYSPVVLNALALQSWGLELASFQERPQVIRLRPLPAEFDLKFSPEDRPKTFSSSAEELIIDLGTTSAPIALVNKDGEGLVLKKTDQRLQIQSYLKLPESLNFHFSLSSPIQEWLETSDDDWIIEQTRKRLELSDPWVDLTAIGLFHRLEEINTRERRQRLVEQLLAGKPLVERQRTLDWALELSEETADKLAARTLEAINRLLRQLGELEEEMEDGEDEFLFEDVLDALYLRDDIQSALLLLSATAAKDRLEEATAAVDALGQELLPMLRQELGLIDDERLRRISANSPKAWWARLSRAPDKDDE